MRTALLATVPLLALLACSTPGHPAKAEPSAAEQQIAARVTGAIWPAVSAYNGAPTQSSAGAKELLAVMDPALKADGAGVAFGALRSAAAELGRQGVYDPATRLSYGNDGLTVAHTDVTAVSDSTATANVCYTYTQWSYVDYTDRRSSPGASQATVELTHVDNVWYLHAISDDHVVASCGTPN